MKVSRSPWILYLLLCGVTFVSLVPIMWALLISLKQPAEAFTVPPTLIFKPTLEFHYQVWFEKGFLKFLLNSVVIAVATMGISLPLGTMAAYALARIRTRGTRSLTLFFLTVRMFPRMLLVIPMFLLARSLNLYDTYTGIVAAMVAINQPFTVWLMRGFILDVPVELDEAAHLDGCGNWQTFLRIIVPTVRPGLVVTALFSLLLAYNEFLLPLVLTGIRTKPLPVAISEYGAENIAYWSLSAAAALGIILPIVLFMIFMHRHLVRGITLGAVKG